jgi:hypothetical protein
MGHAVRSIVSGQQDEPGRRPGRTTGERKALALRVGARAGRTALRRSPIDPARASTAGSPVADPGGHERGSSFYLAQEIRAAREAVSKLDAAVGQANSFREKCSRMLEEAHRALSRLEQVGRGHCPVLAQQRAGTENWQKSARASRHALKGGLVRGLVTCPPPLPVERIRPAGHGSGCVAAHGCTAAPWAPHLPAGDRQLTPTG